MSGELYNEYGDINFDSENISTNGHHSNKHKIYKALEQDSNYLSLTISVSTQHKYNTKSKNVKVGCFMSGLSGSTIVNAVTGQKYRGHIVGKYDEDLYFKVMLCAGENGSNPVTLFYDNPTQYEKHFYKELSQNSKDEWFEKYEYQQEIEDRKQKKAIV